MAGGEENGTEGSPGEPLPPPDEPPQPRPGPPHREDEQEEEGEEEEPERSEAHLEGVLDEDTAAKGLHTFGRSAPGTEYVYLHLSLPGRGLSDISILSGYIHLQKMELSSNKINDLSCVSHMPYLVELDASKNQLTTYFDFKAPKNLKEVDFSHNQIPKMKDLSAYHSLTKLLLDFNEIQEIRGLEQCHSLAQLGLSHNRLRATRGLQDLPLRDLNLSFNQIEKVDGLKSLKSLQRVDLSNNKIKSLQGLEEHDLLEMINLEDNQVAEVSELKWIKDLPLLRDVNLLKNPLQEKEGYWLSAIFMLLQVTELDLKKVSVEEKVAAVNAKDPPPEVVAAEDHRTHLLCNARQPQGLLDSTLPGFDEPYPMLVLLGPVAGGRRQLSLKICRQFKNFFRFGPCHTTRTAYFGEENRFDYYFISQEEFDKMVEAGKFLATYKYSGHSYGLGRDTVESIAREGLATCVHLEIEGVRSLKNTYFKPRAEIREAVARVDTYLQINQDFPGYFHAVIYTDELEQAFTELTHLVKVYLGLEPPDSLDIQGTKSGAGSRNQLFPEEKSSPGQGTPRRSRTPSSGDILEPSAQTYPRELLEMLTAPPGSVEEASLQRRFSAARQRILFHRDVDPDSGCSHLQLPKPLPPLSSGARRGHQELKVPRAAPESSSREFGRLRGRFSVPSGAAPARADQVVWTKFPIPRRHLPGKVRAAGKGVDTSKEAGENLLRKSSKAKLGSSPALPRIPPGQTNTNP
uniref:Leucine rich repeats and guanylate kinase domain containing n=1 Tax=Taeniopygia guttata TaxID=59729 RepID=A0A674HNH3_TAEGU|nr:leucine-rich repeat and guanylate kinase domain-containing protein isoform X2 [Taeniopygia guttata]